MRHRPPRSPTRRVAHALVCGGLALGLFVCAALTAEPARAVIVDSGDGAGNIDPPDDLPWWDHVNERLGGTTIIYLGHGWVLTARHVGMGSLLIGGKRFEPDPETLIEFGEPGRPADLIAFRLKADRVWPDLPLLPISEVTPARGEEVLMVGNGRNRGKRLRARREGETRATGWSWGPGSKKRWGTNSVDLVDQVIEHSDTSTPSFATRFESIFMGDTTMHEAQAASGDSGGAVFKRVDPDDPESEWVLAGVMFTVRHPYGGPDKAALYGDFTYIVDVARYRDELIAAVRPVCANERDDDGDGLIDHPDDPDCVSPFTLDEGSGEVGPGRWTLLQVQIVSIAAVALFGLMMLTVALWPRR